MFKNEIKHLVLLGVLEIFNNPESAKLKPKPDQVRILSDFININKQLKRKTHPVPKINEMLLKLEGFQYAMSLDLNMGYYHIQLSKDESNLHTIIIPWEE